MEHILRKPFLLNLLVPLATMAALPAFCFDVSGVQLGSDLNGAIQQLKQVNPKFQIITISSVKEQTGLIGVAKEPRPSFSGEVVNTPVDEMLVFKAELDKIWYIERDQYPARDQGFTADTLKSALLKKYGPPSKPDEPSNFEQPGIKSGYMAWAYDRSGKQSFVEYKLPPGTFPENQVVCSYVQLASKQSPVNDFSTSIQFPYSTTKTCGVILQAYWESVDGFVKRYMVSAYDVKTLYDYQIKLARQAEADKQRAFDEQVNKKIAPKL